MIDDVLALLRYRPLGPRDYPLIGYLGQLLRATEEMLASYRRQHEEVSPAMRVNLWHIADIMRSIKKIEEASIVDDDQRVADGEGVRS